MDFDTVTDWWWNIVEFVTDIDLSFFTDIGENVADFFGQYDFGLGESNQFAVLLSGSTGMMLTYFWIFDPLNMGMDTVPLYLRVTAIVIATVAGYVMASKMIDG